MVKKTSISFLSSKKIPSDLMKLNVTDTDYIHVDVMDGKFVKEKTLRFKDMKNIYKYTSKRLDVHLMVKDVKKEIKNYALLNTEFITFHLETTSDTKKLIDLIHSYGIKAGIAIKPGTDVEMIYPYIDDIELVLVMSVEPGKGGQDFLKDTTARLHKLREKIEREHIPVLLEVDGGINPETKDDVRDADILVSGSYVLNSDNYQEAITKLR